MAKFCNQCGRPLQEGEVCICQQQNYAVGTQQYNPNAGMKQPQGAGGQPLQGTGHRPAPGMGGQAGNGYPQMQAGSGYPSGSGYPQSQAGMGGQAGNGYPQSQAGMGGQAGNGYPQSQAGMGGQAGPGYQQPYGQRVNRIAAETRNLFARILPVLKDPVGETERISYCGSSVVGLEMVIANLITMLLIMIIAMFYVDSKIGAVSSWVQIPYVRLTIGVVFMAAATYFSMAGLLYLCSKVFFKAPTDFGAIISIVGVKALLDAMVTIVGILFVMLIPVLGAALLVIGGLYTTLVCLFGYAQTVPLDGSKKVYSLLITYIVQFLMFCLIYMVVLADLVTRLGSLF